MGSLFSSAHKYLPNELIWAFYDDKRILDVNILHKCNDKIQYSELCVALCLFRFVFFYFFYFNFVCFFVLLFLFVFVPEYIFHFTCYFARFCFRYISRFKGVIPFHLFFVWILQPLYYFVAVTITVFCVLLFSQPMNKWS